MKLKLAVHSTRCPEETSLSGRCDQGGYQVLVTALAVGCSIAIGLLGLPSEAHAAESESAKVNVAGHKVVLGTLAEGATAYSNRNYVFENVPEVLKGLQFTQLPGGERALVRIADAQAGTVVYAITSAASGHLEGWDPVAAEGFCYTDHNRTPLAVYRRKIDELPLVIPQRGWTGTMLAAGEIALIEADLRPDLSLVPGVVIDHSPATSRLYIGSPSIARAENGTYFASHDLFGPGEGAECTLVFRSDDGGRHWKQLAKIPQQFWSTIFIHRGDLYLIGTYGQYGAAVIRRSSDGGKTWTTPENARSGLLDDSARYHCAPVPVVEHDGRLWRGMEDAMGGGGWGEHFRALMLSAPVDADLLDAGNWTFSERLAGNPDWLDGHFGGWLEGNAVVTPGGEIVDILRVHNIPDGNVAAMIHLSEDGESARFDPERDFIPLPGGSKKFTIRFDPVSQKYWSLVNYVPPDYDGGHPDRVRNTLALSCSEDLRQWTIRAILLHHPDIRYHGFQYVDWLFEGNDIIAVSRTAYDDGLGGAHNYHDANFMTFHRVEGFRELQTPLSLPERHLGEDD